MRFYGLNVVADNPFTQFQLETEQFMTPMDVCDSVWTYENGECKEVKSL
jgi:hypothetical protein